MTWAEVIRKPKAAGLVVLETDDNGAVSAYVPGLPVYAAADSHATAERVIRDVLTEYLNAHPATRPDARVRVAHFSDTGKRRVEIVGVRVGGREAHDGEGSSIQSERSARWASCEGRDHPEEGTALTFLVAFVANRRDDFTHRADHGVGGFFRNSVTTVGHEYLASATGTLRKPALEVCPPS